MNASIETTLDEAAQDKLREEVRAVMATDKLSQRQVADQAGLTSGVLSPWLSRTYAGNNERVAQSVERWLQSHREKKLTRKAMPTAPAFVETAGAIEFLNVLSYAHAAPDFAVVMGAPGVGKTTALDWYQKNHPNVWTMTGAPSKANTHAMLTELSGRMGFAKGVPSKLVDQIVSRTKGVGALIAIDEAHHLQTSAIDELRSIHDVAGVGIALLGNEELVNKLGDQARKPRLAMLYSRVGLRVNRTKVMEGDVDALLAAWNVDDEQQAAFLRRIATKPGSGALRAVTKTLKLAHFLAGGEPPTLDHVRRAWSRTGGAPLLPSDA